MTFVLLLLIAILMAALGLSVFYVVRFARIIFLFEDDLSETIMVHERSLMTLDKFINTPLFSYDQKVITLMKEAKEDVTLCRAATQKIISNFTKRSRQKYIQTVEATMDDE